MAARVILLILDSLGIGSAPDADRYGPPDCTDQGADTLGHIAQHYQTQGRTLSLPNLSRLGLAHAAQLSTGHPPAGLAQIPPRQLTGAYACAREVSQGKDTPSGHWEIAGVPVPFQWTYFPKDNPTAEFGCFPPALIQHLHHQGKLKGSLGHCHASGTEIIAQHGLAHLRTHHPIFYTSADSVFQIAAHETHFGLQRLYHLCELAREWFDQSHLKLGRVIARPFIGENPETFQRTGNRHDYALPPPAPTILDHLQNNGGTTIGLGKIGDIYAHRGLTQTRRAHGHPALWQATHQALAETQNTTQPTLIITNFVDFDALYGHRRDPLGYGQALIDFDQTLPALQAQLSPTDLLILTADHGNDPTWPGTDHTREHVPILLQGPPKLLPPGTNLGLRPTFADIAQTIATYLHLPPMPHGTSMISYQ